MRVIITSLLLLCLVAVDARAAVVNTTPVSAEQTVVQLRQLSQLDVPSASQAVVKRPEDTISTTGALDSPEKIAPASSDWKNWLTNKVRFSAWYKSLLRAVRVSKLGCVISSKDSGMQ
jgi:hypothetical protein